MKQWFVPVTEGLFLLQRKPLYGFGQDKKLGDTMGHNVRDVWFVAQP